MSRLNLLSILLVLVLAAVVRFRLIDAQSLWHDEGNSYVQATRSFSAIAENAARDIHPPGYYWLLAIWRGLMGESEFALRSLSAFASLLSVAFTYAIGRQLFGSIAGLTAAIFVTLNTFSIYYAQEARMYALLTLWGVMSMWAFVGFIKTGGWRFALLLALVNAAGLYTQYAFPFVMLAQGVLFVLWSVYTTAREGLKPLPTITRHTLLIYLLYIIANLLTIALYSPWMFTAWEQVTTWPNTGEAIPFSEALATILGYFAFGITSAGGLTIAVVFFLLFGLVVRPMHSQRHTLTHSQVGNTLPVWWQMLVPVIWIIVTIGAFLALGLFREANLKFLLPAQIAFALWMGRGVSVLWHFPVEARRLPQMIADYVPKTAALFGVFIIMTQLWEGLAPLYHAEAYQRDDYRAIVEVIESDSHADDAIILNAPNQQEVFSYYYTGETAVYPLPRGLGGDDAAALAETRQIITQHERIFAVLWGTAERDPNNIVENTLDAEAYEVDSTWYGDVRLVRYTAPVDFTDFIASGVQFGNHITLERHALSAAQVQPGDVLQLQLEWQTNTRIDQQYKVFVQLLDENGFLVAQRDAEPAGGAAPTTTWEPGATIIDRHALLIPPDLLPGDYTLITGLYDMNAPLERLPVNEGDALMLAEIVVR